VDAEEEEDIWYEGYRWEPEPQEPYYPEVFETDNPVVAVLLGPDGEPLVEMRERREVTFGFARYLEERDEW